MDLTDRVDIAIQQARVWLTDSGIQNMSDRLTDTTGSVNAWYDAREESYSYAYSEITGYYITTMLYLNSIDPDPSLVGRAIQAANWLANGSYITDKGFRCRYYHDKDEFLSHICSFDNGICLNSLVNLYKVTGEECYLVMAKQIGTWLVDNMQKPDGSFHPKYDCDKDELTGFPNTWSTQSGSFQTKIGIGLLNLANATEDASYHGVVRSLCDFALAKQQKDGRFATNTCTNSTYIHPHCYTVEGLASAGILLKNMKYVMASLSGSQWLTKTVLDNGGISHRYDGNDFETDEHVDSLAQVIRLWSLGPKRDCQEQVERLLGYQCHSDDPKTNGGFYYGTKDSQLMLHVNAHATMFALQAMMVWKGGKPLSFFDLI